jgi:hypothetical protein
MANGVSTLNGVDGRSLVARRYREVAAQIASDLGGADDLTEGMRQIVRTAAGLVVLREDLDVKIINGQKVDTGDYTRIANSLRRVLVSIGLERRAKDVTPDPLDYARRYSRHADAEDREAAE